MLKSEVEDEGDDADDEDDMDEDDDDEPVVVYEVASAVQPVRAAEFGVVHALDSRFRWSRSGETFRRAGVRPAGRDGRPWLG